MKTNKWMIRLLSSALIALGFTSCEDMEDEYGSPSRDFQVKGVVTDEAGNPIENIRVIIRNAWDNTPNPYADDTVYTDKEGAFTNEMTGTVGIDKQKVYFDDVDGEANGGLFQSDSTNIADMEATLIEEGHGNWYQGKYEFEIQQKLKKKEAK